MGECTLRAQSCLPRWAAAFCRAPFDRISTSPASERASQPVAVAMVVMTVTAMVIRANLLSIFPLCASAQLHSCTPGASHAV